MVNSLMNGLVSWLAEKVIDLLGGLLAFLTSSVFASPDVTVLPQVQSIAGKGALVVNACFILAIIAVGVAAMVGDPIEVGNALTVSLSDPVIQGVTGRLPLGRLGRTAVRGGR